MKLQAVIAVVLLGIEIDDKLNFENHTHNLVRKSAGNLTI